MFDVFFSSWFRMKLRPWFSSKTARAASSHTQSSLQLRWPKHPPTQRTIFSPSSPVTAQSPKMWPVTMTAWQLLHIPRLAPLHLRSRDRRPPTRGRSGRPQCSAAATGLCLLGKQAWNLLGLRGKMRMVVKRGRSIIGPLPSRKTQRLWLCASRMSSTRGLLKWRTVTHRTTSREHLGVSKLFITTTP